MNYFVRTAVALAATSAAAVLAASIANAQSAPQNGWYKVCAKQEENDICNVQFQSVASNGQLVTAVSLATIKGKINRRVFQVTVPTGRLIPAGIKVKIDENKENTMSYFICIPQSCMAEAPLDDNLVAILKNGKAMVITSTNFQNRPNPVTITLEGLRLHRRVRRRAAEAGRIAGAPAAIAGGTAPQGRRAAQEASGRAGKSEVCAVELTQRFSITNPNRKRRANQPGVLHFTVCRRFAAPG
jgi:invasion protein IalB